MSERRFRTRKEAQAAYPLAQMFDDLIVYINNSTIEKAQTLTITKAELDAFVAAGKTYALGTPKGKLPRYDVFDVLYREIDKCTNGKPTTGISSILYTWSADRMEVLIMHMPKYAAAYT